MEEERPVEGLDKKEILKYTLVFFGVIVLIPLAVGLPLSLVFKTFVYLESLFIVFGAFGLLVVVFRSRRRDSRNYKNNKTIFEDKTTSEFKSYRLIQWILVGVSLFALLCSLFSFLIGNAVFPG